MRSSTEGPPLRRAPVVPLLLTAALLSGSYAFERNQNLVFLTILAAVALAILAATRSRVIANVTVAMAGFWAFWPAAVSLPPFIDPAVVDNHTARTSRIGATEQWNYRFTLRGLDRHTARCGHLQGMLFLDGENLNAATIDVVVDGAPASPPEFLRSNTLDQIRIAVALDGQPAVVVRLRPKPGQTPEIRVGPEALGSTIFSDAVFLELKNDNCTVLYQTLRDRQPAAAGD